MYEQSEELEGLCAVRDVPSVNVHSPLHADDSDGVRRLILLVEVLLGNILSRTGYVSGHKSNVYWSNSTNGSLDEPQGPCNHRPARNNNTQNENKK